MTTRLPSLSMATLLLVLAAGAADSAEVVPATRLVPGGGAEQSLSAPPGESRQPLVSSGRLSAGTVAGGAAPLAPQGLSFGATQSPLAVGGYVALGGANSQLSSSLKSDGATQSANISASVGGGVLGQGNRAALSLGMSRISPNSQYSGLAPTESTRARGDVNMSVSVTHQVSPAFSVGGMAGANRASGSDGNESGLMLGAGLGYRF